MTNEPPAGVVLEVKKYPNRRLYDATRSCHVTAAELYDLVAGGRTVRVRDSKTGEDITNQVLLQALIERDPLKINAVPPILVHMMIRVNQQLMASWFDLFLRWMTDGSRSAGGAGPAGLGSGWGSGWPAGGGGGWPGGWTPPGWAPPGGPGASALSPMAWMETFFRPAGASSPPGANPGDPREPPPRPEDDWPEDAEPPEPRPDPDLDQLREQVAMLAEEIARLRSEREGGSA